MFIHEGGLHPVFKDTTYIKKLFVMAMKLGIKPEEFPRLHYMTIVRNKDQNFYTFGGKWDSITVGEDRSFKEKGTNDFEDLSAVVFPYSIPDGDRHRVARQLYKTEQRFAHRKEND